MTKWLVRNKKVVIRAAFLIPIFLVAAISISHVVRWYDLANPISWAIYLSIAIEVAAMSAIAASSVKVKGFSIWFVFVIVTLIQFIGNIFFSYTEIDAASKSFQDWSELSAPVFEMMGSDVSDVVSQKRWLALLEGGLLPLISLTCLHFFIKYGEIDNNEESTVNSNDEPEEVYEGDSLEDNIESEEYVESDESEVIKSPTSVFQATRKGHEIIKAKPRISEKMRKITQK
jgi:hypothetical protein